MTIKNEKLTLQDVEDMCRLAHEHMVEIEITVEPEQYEVSISPWLPTKMETSAKSSVDDSMPNLVIRDTDIEALEKMMDKPVEIVSPTIEVTK